jgi:hypothetical protein
MHRIIEVAHMLGVSKVTIYKKISALKSEIKPYVIKDKNVTFLMDEAVDLIKVSLKHVHQSEFSLEDTSQSSYGLHTMTKEAYIKEQEHKELIAKEHFDDLVMLYDYLKTIKKGKLDRLKSLQMAVEDIRVASNDLKMQIEELTYFFNHSSH